MRVGLFRACVSRAELCVNVEPNVRERAPTLFTGLCDHASLSLSVDVSELRGALRCLSSRRDAREIRTGFTRREKAPRMMGARNLTERTHHNSYTYVFEESSARQRAFTALRALSVCPCPSPCRQQARSIARTRRDSYCCTYIRRHAPTPAAAPGSLAGIVSQYINARHLTLARRPTRILVFGARRWARPLLVVLAVIDQVDGILPLLLLRRPASNGAALVHLHR